MHIITMRDECGTWYLDAAHIEGRKVAVSSLSTERRDALPFYTEAYARKIAAMCEAKWKAQESGLFVPPRGPFKVRAC